MRLPDGVTAERKICTGTGLEHVAAAGGTPGVVYAVCSTHRRLAQHMRSRMPTVNMRGGASAPSPHRQRPKRWRRNATRAFRVSASLYKRATIARDVLITPKRFATRGRSIFHRIKHKPYRRGLRALAHTALERMRGNTN